MRRREHADPVVVDRIRRQLGRHAESPVVTARQVAAAMNAALAIRNIPAARAMGRTLMRPPDLRAEKILSHRYRFVWLCVPKVASRSIIEGLLSADPEAELITGRTIDEILADHPRARGYFSFAFVRDPCQRTLSCYLDKLAVPCDEPIHRERIEPYYGLRAGMSFKEVCRWLATPFGADTFAERHWLSQHLQIRIGGGLPDFVGAYEDLEADWRTVSSRIGLPLVDLPRLNAAPAGPAQPFDDEIVALLRRRYADDFELLRQVTARSRGGCL